MQLFHERHRKLLFLSILGGIYLPGFSRIFPSKRFNTFLRGYAAALTSGYILLGIFAMREMIFLADTIVFKIVSLNNVCDYILAFGRALLFNVNCNQAQALYDLWDIYFTGDGNDEARKKILENLKKPYKKYIICCAALINGMALTWAVDQFDNENCEFSLPMGIPFHKRNPDYLISATFIFVMFTFFGSTVLTADLLIMEPMSWIAAEYMRLRESLPEILNTLKLGENGEIIRRNNGYEQIVSNKQELEIDFKLVDKKIKKWIIEHQKLIKFHKEMVAVNHWPLTVQLLVTTLAMCLFSYLLALQVLPPTDTVVVIFSYFPNYLLFYFIARYGDIVKEQAADVFDSAFAKNWAIYPNHIQRNFQMILMHTNYPLTVNIIKLYPLNSKTYLQIVQTAYSLFNFLLFLTNKHNDS